MITGASHHFFLILKKSQNSLNIESFPIALRPAFLKLPLVTCFIKILIVFSYPVSILIPICLSIQ